MANFSLKTQFGASNGASRKNFCFFFVREMETMNWTPQNKNSEGFPSKNHKKLLFFVGFRTLGASGNSGDSPRGLFPSFWPSGRRSLKVFNAFWSRRSSRPELHQGF